MENKIVGVHCKKVYKSLFPKILRNLTITLQVLISVTFQIHSNMNRSEFDFHNTNKSLSLS